MSVDPAAPEVPAGAGSVTPGLSSDELLIAQHAGYNAGYAQGRRDQRTGQVLWLFIILLPVVWAASYVHGETVRQCFANTLYALGAEIALGGVSLLIKRG